MIKPLYLFSQKAIKYFSELKSPKPLPHGIAIMNPYSDNKVKKVIREFYNNFFHDTNKRIFILGINPGRFGGGVTGIAFTDPVVLEKCCGIQNDFRKKRELSSKFVYKFIEEFGGAKKFYSNFFVGAIYPLALLKDGKNHNYYDSSCLYAFLRPHIFSSLKAQIKLGARKDIAICLGKNNAKYLGDINEELSYFKKIDVLEHPRYIMQYKLKKINDYIQKYVDVLRSSLKEIPQ